MIFIQWSAGRSDSIVQQTNNFNQKRKGNLGGQNCSKSEHEYIHRPNIVKTCFTCKRYTVKSHAWENQQHACYSMPDRVPEDMPEHIAEDMPDRMPEDMPDRMPEDMPDKMPEDMTDRVPEDLPVTKRIDVMVGITRSKVIFAVEVFLIRLGVSPMCSPPCVRLCVGFKFSVSTFFFAITLESIE